MTLTLTNIKFINADAIDDFDQLNFTADFVNDDDNETYTLNISYRPLADNDDIHELYLDIDGQSHTDDIDTIADSQYFDDDALAFFIATARSAGFDV